MPSEQPQGFMHLQIAFESLRRIVKARQLFKIRYGNLKLTFPIRIGHGVGLLSDRFDSDKKLASNTSSTSISSTSSSSISSTSSSTSSTSSSSISSTSSSSSSSPSSSASLVPSSTHSRFPGTTKKQREAFFYRKRISVEFNLTSNEFLLSNTGKKVGLEGHILHSNLISGHPFVPRGVFGTDDDGIFNSVCVCQATETSSHTLIALEICKAIQHQLLPQKADLERMITNGLDFKFGLPLMEYSDLFKIPLLKVPKELLLPDFVERDQDGIDPAIFKQRYDVDIENRQDASDDESQPVDCPVMKDDEKRDNLDCNWGAFVRGTLPNERLNYKVTQFHHTN